MPYTISEDAEGCDGFAVIKIEDESIVPGGCHSTQDEAAAHLAALEIAEAEEERALDSYPPTDAMVEEAQRGLDWRSEYGRGGTEIGIARARDIVNRRNLPIDTWRRIKAYFDRHQVDREAEGWSQGEDGYPSNGRIAWALWGGDSAWSRAKAILEDVSNDETVRSEVDNIETRDADAYPLAPVQSAIYGDMESLVEVFGMFDKGIGSHGSHYVEPDNNPFMDEGIVCSSCAFYEGPRGCEIVAGDIDPNAICRFWLIPEQLLDIQSSNVESEEEPMEEDMTMQPVRYSMLETEHRRINGRDVEFRTMEVGGLELRAADSANGSPVFSGYAAVFNSPSEPLPFIETIAPGAFRRTLKSEREIRMFVNHDSGQPLATTRNGSLRLSEDARGLRAEADLPDTTAGRDLATLIQSGVVHSMSFGFSIPRGGDSFSDDGQTREIREAILHEVSIVTGFPAYPATSGVAVRNTEQNDVEQSDERSLPVALAQRILDLNSKR